MSSENTRKIFENITIEIGNTSTEMPVVSVKRARYILGRQSDRTTLVIYTQTMRRQHEDTADKIIKLFASRTGLKSCETIGKQLTPR